MRVGNPNKLKPVPDDVNTFLDLPESWAYPKIGEILTVNYGKGLKESVRVPMAVAVYGSNGIVGQHHIALTKGPTIIIGRKGTVGAVHFSNDACWPIDTTYYIDEFNGLEPKYLLYSLRSLSLTELDTSTAIPGLNRNELYDQHLPLSPLTEQKRIVAKLEGLLTRVNATKERLAKVSMVLKRFRQAVLAAACSGRLTADWREIHVHKETAEMFVARILEQRKAQWKVEEAAESGSNDSQTRRSRRSRYKEPLEPTYHLELELPDTWCFATVDQLTSLVTKGSSPGWQGFEYIESGVPFVRSQNVRWGTLDLSDLAYLPFEFNETHANSIIHIGDVLLNLVGASVGRAAIAAKEIENANCNQAVGIIRLVQDGVINRYLMLYFLSPQAQDHIHATKADFARANFNLDDIKPMIVPIPPLIEQQEIVRHVESMFKLADAIEKRVATATVRVEKLTQSILAKAFKGELVPTEAELARRDGRSFETASELLARIKSDRETSKTSISDHVHRVHKR